jgi:hypothetical protein
MLSALSQNAWQLSAKQAGALSPALAQAARMFSTQGTVDGDKLTIEVSFATHRVV